MLSGFELYPRWVPLNIVLSCLMLQTDLARKYLPCNGFLCQGKKILSPDRGLKNLLPKLNHPYLPLKVKLLWSAP